jgi:hypothetical protein
MNMNMTMEEFHKLYTFMQLSKDEVINFFDAAPDDEIRIVMGLMKQYEDYCASIGQSNASMKSGLHVKVIEPELLTDLINDAVDDFLRGMTK